MASQRPATVDFSRKLPFYTYRVASISRGLASGTLTAQWICADNCTLETTSALPILVNTYPDICTVLVTSGFPCESTHRVTVVGPIQ